MNIEINMILIILISSFIFLLEGVYGSIVHQDEFNGPTLDYSKWNVLVTDSPYNDELQYYGNRTENIFIGDGKLIIRPIKESHAGRHYTSGRISSKFAWKYGRVEVRAKLPNGFGLWPAIWMMSRDEVHGGWPSSGEIDIMEGRGQELDTIQTAIHYGTCCNDINTESSGRLVVPDCSIDNFHIYSLDWTPTELVFRLDGKAYDSRDLDRELKPTLYDNKGDPFNELFYLILNVAVGGNFLNDPTPSTVWNYPEAEMQVDFVRVYPLEDIAQLRCVVKKDFLISDLCSAVGWLCNDQKFADVSDACTEELMNCCNPSCSRALFSRLASDLFTLYDSILNDANSCDFGGTGTKKYVLLDGAPTERRCVIKHNSTPTQICGGMVWACGGENIWADVSAECTLGQDVLQCCSRGDCDETRLREAAELVFQEYYSTIPSSGSCDFGGTTELIAPAVQCTDGYNKLLKNNSC